MNPTGPRTEEGKNRSRMNAFKHGLTGQTLILSEEEKVLYEEHRQSYVDLYRPRNNPEKTLVQLIADDYWRLLRGRAFEASRIRMTMDGDSVATPVTAPEVIWSQNEKVLVNLTLYIQRIERSIKNNTQALKDLQSDRKAAEKKAHEEVKVLARAAYADGRAYDPTEDFPAGGQFVFSSKQVAEMVSREDRLKRAELWQGGKFLRALEPQKLNYTVKAA